VTIIGLTAYASAAGDSSQTASAGGGGGVEAASPSQPAAAVAAEQLRDLQRAQGAEVVGDAIRTAPAPGGEGRPWALAPTRDGGVCASTSRVVFCGSSRAAVEAGRASATEYPSDKYLGKDPRTGLEMVEPSDGTGVRHGVAPTAAVEVVVLDGGGRVLRRESVANGVYEVAVPQQGSDARVAFIDPNGGRIVTRPAEG
jgi:hypothetical protein